jgi:hypothetical protein
MNSLSKLFRVVLKHSVNELPIKELFPAFVTRNTLHLTGNLCLYLVAVSAKRANGYINQTVQTGGSSVDLLRQPDQHS